MAAVTQRRPTGLGGRRRLSRRRTFTVGESPPERTCYITAESRELRIDPEIRTVQIAAEARETNIESEVRTIQIARENRTSRVG